MSDENVVDYDDDDGHDDEDGGDDDGHDKVDGDDDNVGDDGHNNQRDAGQRRDGTTGGNMRRCDAMRCDATRREGTQQSTRRRAIGQGNATTKLLGVARIRHDTT